MEVDDGGPVAAAGSEAFDDFEHYFGGDDAVEGDDAVGLSLDGGGDGGGGVGPMDSSIAFGRQYGAGEVAGGGGEAGEARVEAPAAGIRGSRSMADLVSPHRHGSGLGRSPHRPVSPAGAGAGAAFTPPPPDDRMGVSLSPSAEHALTPPPPAMPTSNSTGDLMSLSGPYTAQPRRHGSRTGPHSPRGVEDALAAELRAAAVASGGIAEDEVDSASGAGSTHSMSSTFASLTVKASPSCPDFSAIRAGKAGVSGADWRVLQSLSLSDAKQQLFELRFAGVLEKKGFRFLKRWRRRLLTLQGRVLSYFTVGRASGAAPGARAARQARTHALTSARSPPAPRPRACRWSCRPTRRWR